MPTEYTGSVDEQSMFEILTYYEKDLDPRMARGKRHNCTLCVLLMLLGTLTNHLSRRAIGDFIHHPDHEAELIRIFSKHFDLRHGLPSYSCLTRLTQKMPMDVLVLALCEWSAQLIHGKSLIQLGIDGQAVRAAINKALTGKSLYNVDFFDVTSRILIWMVRVGDKTNEAKSVEEVIPEILFGCTDTVVCGDAMLTKQVIVDAIQNSHCHTLVPVKRNNPTLMDAVLEAVEKFCIKDSNKVGHYVDLDGAVDGIGNEVVIDTMCTYDEEEDDMDKNNKKKKNSHPVQDVVFYDNVYAYLSAVEGDGDDASRVNTISLSEGANGAQETNSVLSEDSAEGVTPAQEPVIVADPVSTEDTAAKDSVVVADTGSVSTGDAAVQNPVVVADADVVSTGEVVLVEEDSTGDAAVQNPVVVADVVSIGEVTHVEEASTGDAAVQNPVVVADADVVSTGEVVHVEEASTGDAAVQNPVVVADEVSTGEVTHVEKASTGDAAAKDSVVVTAPVSTGEVIRVEEVSHEEFIRVEEASGNPVFNLGKALKPVPESALDETATGKWFLIGERYILLVPSHGRFERREYELITVDDTDLFEALPENIKVAWSCDAEAVGVVTRYRAERKRVKGTNNYYWHVSVTRTAYLLGFVPESAEEFGTYVRSYWDIENGLHYVVDTLLEGDRCTCRKENAPFNASLIKKISFNVISKVLSLVEERDEKEGRTCERYYSKIYNFIKDSNKASILSLFFEKPTDAFNAFAARIS